MDSIGFNVEEARKEAQKELNVERQDAARKRLKLKLKELEDAHQIVKNIESELVMLEHELSRGL